MATKEQMPERLPSKADKIFTLIKTDDKFQIAIGNYIISRETFKTASEADKYIKSKPYELIINTACLFADQTRKAKK